MFWINDIDFFLYPANQQVFDVFTKLDVDELSFRVYVAEQYLHVQVNRMR